MSACLRAGKPLSIAFSPAGALPRPPPSALWPRRQHRAVRPIDEAFRSVESRALDYVVAPVENSTEGAWAALDLMDQHPAEHLRQWCCAFTTTCCAKTRTPRRRKTRWRSATNG